MKAAPSVEFALVGLGRGFVARPETTTLALSDLLRGTFDASGTSADMSTVDLGLLACLWCVMLTAGGGGSFVRLIGRVSGPLD